MKEAEWLEVEPLLTQFNHIQGLRDTILHYGAKADNSGNRTVSTAIKSHMASKTKTYHVSVELLESMREDIKKIVLSLHLHHMGRPAPRAKHPEFDAILRAPWQYTPPPNLPVKGEK